MSRTKKKEIRACFNNSTTPNISTCKLTNISIKLWTCVKCYYEDDDVQNNKHFIFLYLFNVLPFDKLEMMPS